MPEYSGLLTDLYELTMAAGYLQTGFDGAATFELFARHLPPKRNYLVAAGLDQAIEFLENVRFSSEDIDYLRRNNIFQHVGADFFDYLAKFRFTGDVWAMPEGTLVFAGEPLLRVTAPIIQGQILETYLLATLTYQTMVASKAARIVTAAKGRRIVDFGARRSHGSEASLFAARAAVIGGCQGTSNVLAGRRFGINTYGTQAHSWVMAHADEGDSFRNFLNVFPNEAVLLLDTYDVRQATKKIIAMGRKPAGVRLDSGDLVKDSRWVRRELDRAGWNDVKVFASGDLDEYKIASQLAKGAAIDAFGVGTALASPGDAPHLSMIYKLVEVERDGKRAKPRNSPAPRPPTPDASRFSAAHLPPENSWEIKSPSKTSWKMASLSSSKLCAPAAASLRRSRSPFSVIAAWPDSRIFPNAIARSPAPQITPFATAWDSKPPSKRFANASTAPR